MIEDTERHVDDFVEHGMKWDHESGEAEVYARWVLMLHRLPAILLNRFSSYISQYPLFCTWRGERYRVTGASRMGDVWLAKNFKRECGYDERVNVAYCSDWSKKP